MAGSEKGKKEKKDNWLWEEKKQKWREDKKAFRSLPLSGKLQYFWDYYKFVLIILLVLIIAVHEGIGIARKARTKTLLSIVMMNNYFGEEAVGYMIKRFEEELGAGKRETVEVDTSIAIEPEIELSQSNMAAQIKLIGLNESRDLDVIIFPERDLDWLQNQGVLMPLEEVIDEETFRDLGLDPVMGYERFFSEPDENGNIEVMEDTENEHVYAVNYGTDSFLTDSGIYFGEGDIMIGFGIRSERTDAGIRFLEFLAGLDVSELPEGAGLPG